MALHLQMQPNLLPGLSLDTKQSNVCGNWNLMQKKIIKKSKMTLENNFELNTSRREAIVNDDAKKAVV